jgi:hypothetical protein
VEQSLRQLFQRGGAIGGISAGAAVMSPVMIRGGGHEPETGPGFGLLPGTVIDQHFLKRGRQDRLLRVLASNPGLVGIGIDEGAALIVQGSRLSVMGDSCVVTCLAASTDWPEEVQQWSPGDEADLTRLVRSAWIRSQPRPAPTEQRIAPGAASLAMADKPAAPNPATSLTRSNATKASVRAVAPAPIQTAQPAKSWPATPVVRRGNTSPRAFARPSGRYVR